MKITAVRCNKCNTIIYSRTRRDFHWCPCESIAIDGGQTDYVRILGIESDHTLGHIEIDVTLQELYNDWNDHTDYYGWITNCKEDFEKFEEEKVKDE